MLWFSELAKEGEGGAFRGGAITPDGLIDEDFEAELGTPPVCFHMTVIWQEKTSCIKLQKCFSY